MGKTYRAIWWRRADEFGLLAIFVLLGASIFTAWNELMLSVMSLMFVCLAIFTAGYILCAGFSVKIGEHHLVCQTLIGKVCVSEPEIESIQILRTGRSGSIRIRRRKKRDVFIPMKAFADPLSLTKDIESWWNGQRPNRDRLAPGETRTFGMQSYPWILLVPAILLLIPVVRSFSSIYDAIPICSLCLPLIVLSILGSVSLFRSRIEICERGISMRRMAGIKRAVWINVNKVTMSTYRIKSTTHESIRVEYPGDQIYISEMFDELPVIRDLIVSLVDPSLVVDNRKWHG